MNPNNFNDASGLFLVIFLIVIALLCMVGALQDARIKIPNTVYAIVLTLITLLAGVTVLFIFDYISTLQYDIK